MPQHKFRQTLKKLERKEIKVIEKSEKNTTKIEEKIAHLVGLDAHKCSALAFCIKVISRSSCSSPWYPRGDGSQRGVRKGGKRADRSRQEMRMMMLWGGRRKPTRMVAGAVLSGQVESGLTMPSHEGRAMVTGERKNPKDLNARAFSGN